MKVKRIAICVEKTLIREFDNIYIHVSDHGEAIEFIIAEHRSTDGQLFQERCVNCPEPILEQYSGPEWKLPSDPHSRVIEYMGRPLHYSAIRFAIMKLLIEANGNPVSFSDVAIAGWSEYVDRSTIEKQVYPLNQFLEKNGIPKVVRCSKETMFLSGEKKTTVKSSCVPEMPIRGYATTQ